MIPFAVGHIDIDNCCQAASRFAAGVVSAGKLLDSNLRKKVVSYFRFSCVVGERAWIPGKNTLLVVSYFVHECNFCLG